MAESVQRLRLPSDITVLSKIEKIVESASEASGISGIKAREFSAAVSEILLNAIVHGNVQSPDKHVDIEVTSGDEQISVVITDQGNGFDQADVPDPRNSERLMETTGRGILVAGLYSDGIEFERREGGMSVRLTRDA